MTSGTKALTSRVLRKQVLPDQETAYTKQGRRGSVVYTVRCPGQGLVIRGHLSLFLGMVGSSLWLRDPKVGEGVQEPAQRDQFPPVTWPIVARMAVRTQVSGLNEIFGFWFLFTFFNYFRKLSKLSKT